MKKATVTPSTVAQIIEKLAQPGLHHATIKSLNRQLIEAKQLEAPEAQLTSSKTQEQFYQSSLR